MSTCALNANKSPGCGRGPAVEPSPPHVLQGGLECDVGPLQPLDAFNSGAAVRTTGPPANREGQHSKWGVGSCKFLWATLE